MGLGRLSQGDKRPIRPIPFNIERLQKELCPESLDKDVVSVVQYKKQGDACDKQS